MMMGSAAFEFISQSSHAVGGAAFTVVSPADYPGLQKVLAKSLCRDPYIRSMAYFAMTGRNGLWKIERGEEMMIICRHPNVDDEFLIFSPMGNASSSLQKIIVRTFSKMGLNARLARVEDETVEDSFVERVPEDVLDWTYPVRILDTALVLHHSGNGFQHFRQKLNALDLAKTRSENMDADLHGDVVLEIVRDWAEGDKDKIDPYLRQLGLFKCLPMAGRIIYYGDRPVGMSIWEETDIASGMANAYTHLALHHIRGASQFVFLDMCRALVERGFKRVCIGGSEDEGLDRFKRNLCPVESVDLTSWAVKAANNHSKPVAADIKAA